jgi:hypothetical protein
MEICKDMTEAVLLWLRLLVCPGNNILVLPE